MTNIFCWSNSCTVETMSVNRETNSMEQSALWKANSRAPSQQTGNLKFTTANHQFLPWTRWIEKSALYLSIISERTIVSVWILIKHHILVTQSPTYTENVWALWSRSSSKYYLKIQFLPERKYNTSPCQQSTGKHCLSK
jgi:hypothetical protein